MAKNSMEWHENCLKNWLAYRDKIKQEVYDRLAELEAELERNEKGLKFYQLQVETAKAEGKDGFDEGKFLVKRNKKGEK